MIRQISLVGGKLRRYALSRFRSEYVDHVAARRQGECNHCGNCCEILFRCPFLITQEDETSQCSIYDDRPGQCAAFPIDARDLADVDFDCTFTFDDPDTPLVDIEPPADATPQEPTGSPGRLNTARPLPLLLLQRLLNRTR